MKDKEQAKPIIKWGHETELVDIEWCWKPYLPYGKVSIIEGDGGDGKTTMILTIAALLSQGRMPPSLIRGHLSEEPDCAPITTFYLTNEDEVADSSLKRFIRAGGDRSRFAYYGELQHHMTITEDELLSAIEETGCRLLIIDPFQAFLPEGTNMGSITKMRAIFTTLSNVAKMTNTAVVLVGHLNKNEGSKDIHRGFGSADIAASVRSILMVEMRKRDRERRWVRAIKSNFDESDYTPIRLILDEERCLSFAEFEDEEEEATPPQSKTERAMEIIADMMVDGSVPVAEATAACAEEGIGDKTAQRASRKLGAIRDFENGIPVWRIPD